MMLKNLSSTVERYAQTDNLACIQEFTDFYTHMHRRRHTKFHAIVPLKMMQGLAQEFISS